MKLKFRISCAWLLMLSLVLSILPSYAVQIAPSAPFWITDEEYLIFENDPLYGSDRWNDILLAREEIRLGTAKSSSLSSKSVYGRVLAPDTVYESEVSPAFLYEKALLQIGNALHGNEAYFTSANTYLHQAADMLPNSDPLHRELILWSQRILFWDGQLKLSTSRYMELYPHGCDKYLAELLAHMNEYQFTLDELRDTPSMAQVPAELWPDVAMQLKDYSLRMEAERKRLKIFVDGEEVVPEDAVPIARNDRTFVPIYMLTGTLGADVTWDGAAQKVTFTRAGKTIEMTLGSTTAFVNGSAVRMDVAPFVENERTYIPIAYVAPFFDQNVKWEGETYSVLVTEDTSTAGNSNLEAWALGMGAILSQVNYEKILEFGTFDRNQSGPVTRARNVLSRSWGTNSRKDLVNVILSMTHHGHNDSFLYDAALINSLTETEYQQLLENSAGMDSYMWPYTKQLSEKWGDRGILCWDLFRMSSLVQWGYTAGYISYAEALVLLEPAATLLKENFSSWEEACENYLDGYNWWARNNVLDTDIWNTERGKIYTRLKETYGDELFNDKLFRTKIIPVPDLTIDDILNTL